MIEKNLLNGGIQRFFYNEKKQVLQFSMEKEYKVDRDGMDYHYEVKVLPSTGLIWIRAIVLYHGKMLGIYNLDWYLKKKNAQRKKQRDGNIQYEVPIHEKKEDDRQIALGCYMKIKTIRGDRIIRQISKMNQILRQDYPEINALCRGKISEEMREEIRREYLQYQGEWVTYDNTDESSTEVRDGTGRTICN